MSANEFLPWVRRAAAPGAQAGMPAPVAATDAGADCPQDLQRRTFIQLLSLGGTSVTALRSSPRVPNQTAKITTAAAMETPICQNCGIFVSEAMTG